jgi:hypothetical protein
MQSALVIAIPETPAALSGTFKGTGARNDPVPAQQHVMPQRERDDKGRPLSTLQLRCIERRIFYENTTPLRT